MRGLLGNVTVFQNGVKLKAFEVGLLLFPSLLSVLTSSYFYDITRASVSKFLLEGLKAINNSKRVGNHVLETIQNRKSPSLRLYII